MKIVLDTMPRLSRNFDDSEIMDFIDYYSSDIEIWNPTVPAHAVSASDDDGDDNHDIDTSIENYKAALSPEQHIPCVFSFSGSCWTETHATFLIYSSHLFLYVFSDFIFSVW